jgi:hypothetical protein
MKTFFIIIGVIVGILLFTWLVEGNNFFLYKYFAPQKEQVRHDVFKNSQAYTDGMVEELQSYMLEYNKADAEAKAALKTVIIRQSAKVDEKYLPDDLKDFIQALKDETNDSTGYKF